MDEIVKMEIVVTLFDSGRINTKCSNASDVNTNVITTIRLGMLEAAKYAINTTTRVEETKEVSE